MPFGEEHQKESHAFIEGENIDVDAIYAELLKQAQKSSMTIDLPVIGPITFGTADVESLYRHIVGA